MRAFLDLRGERRRGRGRPPPDLALAGRPRRGSNAWPGRGTSVNGPAFGVELGRGVVMRKGMGKLDDQRRLVVAPFPDGDADAVADLASGGRRRRRRAARRSSSPDGEAQRPPRRSPGVDRRPRSSANRVNCRARRPALKRVDQVRVRDVEAEGGEADLAGVEGHFGRAEQPPCGVDDAERTHRRGFGRNHASRHQAVPEDRPSRREAPRSARPAGAGRRDDRHAHSPAAVEASSAAARPAGPAPTTMMSWPPAVIRSPSPSRPGRASERRHHLPRQARTRRTSPATKGSTEAGISPRLAMAGPGQSPERPQPTPKMAAPSTSGRSISEASGRARNAAPPAEPAPEHAVEPQTEEGDDGGAGHDENQAGIPSA